MVYKNNDSINDLLKQAGDKIGTDPGKLKQTIDSGKLDDLVKKMNPRDAQKFQEILSNPQLAQQMLNTPQAQMLIKQFMK
ncbi:MAG: hypothetical protein RR444_00740 [Oscillospiraceae bacterium]